ncbi:hypothetical protein P154DRAFT_561814, partial [Amniculicola lignicola CBS 123094]
MLGQTVLFSAFLAFATFAQAAPPPACVLGVVNAYKDPADVASVCKSKDIVAKLAKVCGDKTEDALSALADICGSEGVEVETDLPKSTTATKTGSTSKPTGTDASDSSAT